MDQYKFCSESIIDGKYILHENVASVKKRKFTILIKDTSKNTLRPDYKLVVVKTNTNVLYVIKNYENETSITFRKKQYNKQAEELLFCCTERSAHADEHAVESTECILFCKSIFVDLLNEWNNHKSICGPIKNLECRN